MAEYGPYPQDFAKGCERQDAFDLCKLMQLTAEAVRRWAAEEHLIGKNGYIGEPLWLVRVAYELGRMGPPALDEFPFNPTDKQFRRVVSSEIVADDG